MPFLSGAYARSIGIHPSPNEVWKYLYDMMKEEWIYIGPQDSPKSIVAKIEDPELFS